MYLKDRKVRTLLRELSLLMLIIILTCLFHKSYARWFSEVGFNALQAFRLYFFKHTILSVGDFLYVCLFVYLLFYLYRFFSRKVWKAKNGWTILGLKSLRAILTLNIVLYFLWGALYEQPKWSEHLGLHVEQVSESDLIAFDSVLISRLNTMAPELQYPDYRHIKRYTKILFYADSIPYRLRAKHCIVGSAIGYLGIEGYFNPFSGEAQINPDIPVFMQPFLLAHEYSHQTGIAAEDDANLKAYVYCVGSNKPSVMYSAYFNLWLYTHRRVMRLDPERAALFKQSLNARTLAQLDTLKKRNEHYDNPLNRGSDIIFDAYLKIQKQKDGIGSYKNVAYSAAAWEKSKGNLP